MTAADVDDPIVLAQSAFDSVEADPVAAGALAERALALARMRRHPEAEVLALHALSFAAHELGDPRSITTIRAAIRAGERHGLIRRTALARRRLALDLASRGSVRAALAELERARAGLDVHEQARSEVFRVGILVYAGETGVSLAGTDGAVATLRTHGDAFWEAQLLRNRSFVLAERGETAAAEADLTRSHELFRGLGADAAARAAEVQLVRIALTRGDLPAALARLDAIHDDGVMTLNAAELELLRARALVTAQLWSEARQALERARPIWERSGRDEHEARLDMVRLTMLAGDSAEAQRLALRAQRSFAAQRRHLHAARAAGLGLIAAAGGGPVRPLALRSGRRAAALLDAAGLHEEGQRVRLAIARAALARGSVGVARRELDACAALRRRGPVTDRIEAWHVQALLAVAIGDSRAALRAAHAGLSLLDDHRASLGATELRAAASQLGVALARLGLRIALEQRDDRAALEWAERLRAGSLRLAPVIPPRAGELRDRTDELRAVSAELSRAQRGARPARALASRQAALEQAIRHLSRHARGPGSVADETIPAGGELSRALADRSLVEVIECDGELTALTLCAGRLVRHELGPVAPVAEELQWLRFALGRLTRGRLAAAQRDSALAGTHASAGELGRRLIEPLAGELGDRELVIVPTGALHALPWAALPQLRGRPVVVSPSAAIWLALQRRPSRPASRRRSRVALVAGPRLRHARAELDALAGLYPGAQRLAGPAASVAATLSALERATLAHVACHGRFRADSPLFSALELADGPLNVYELQRLRRVPGVIVLSACDLAYADARPGDELLGFASALIAMGARSVIASVVPVPDATAKRLMIALHRRLVAGASPAVALAGAQSALDARRAAAAGFICLGTG
jgi:hypothetical protein